MQETLYNGTHIILTIKVIHTDLLIQFNQFDQFISKLFGSKEIEVVGKTHHIFDNESYTAVYCLKESHLSIHTWPELNKINFDIFLCNYSKDNTEICKEISDNVVIFFNGSIIQKDIIYRK